MACCYGHGMSVGLSVTIVSSAKVAELIDVLLEMLILVDPRNYY